MALIRVQPLKAFMFILNISSAWWYRKNIVITSSFHIRQMFNKLWRLNNMRLCNVFVCYEGNNKLFMVAFIFAQGKGFLTWRHPEESCLFRVLLFKESNFNTKCSVFMFKLSFEDILVQCAYFYVQSIMFNERHRYV